MLLYEIKARNVLSFGPEGLSLELRPLNVLIGPNGSGKSNLLELVALMRGAPTSLTSAIRDSGGGVQDWIFKGDPRSTAKVEAVVNPGAVQLVRHCVEFRESGQQFMLVDEWVQDAAEFPQQPAHPVVLYQFQDGQPVVRVQEGELRGLPPQLPFGSRADSILAQLKDPVAYPQLTHLGLRYERVRLYREWSFGGKTVFRQPQKADLRTDRLEEDFSNLAMFVNKLRRHPTTKAAMLEYLRDLYDGLTDFDLSVEGGTVQLFFTEGDFTIPATRLSDGSLRYLCLLAILLDPDPPPLICVEEPELGLHPDLLHKIADLLVDASQRCQLIVTTHSDILLDSFTKYPESVVVCERVKGATSMKRLDADRLREWLERYRLGELWTKGEIGGVRW